MTKAKTESKGKPVERKRIHIGDDTRPWVKFPVGEPVLILINQDKESTYWRDAKTDKSPRYNSWDAAAKAGLDEYRDRVDVYHVIAQFGSEQGVDQNDKPRKPLVPGEVYQLGVRGVLYAKLRQYDSEHGVYADEVISITCLGTGKKTDYRIEPVEMEPILAPEIDADESGDPDDLPE